MGETVACLLAHWRVTTMKRAMIVVAATVAALLGAGGAATAQEKASGAREVRTTGEHRMTGGYWGNGRRYSGYKARPQVRGYVARRGGYSYYIDDTTNTYGDSRNLYGSSQSFRHWSFDRQTNSGPFDHGFFFDSGIAPRGGDSPYLR
jgi:hypothetical protein